MEIIFGALLVLKVFEHPKSPLSNLLVKFKILAAKITLQQSP